MTSDSGIKGAVCIDLDGVIFDFHKDFSQYLRERGYGVKVKQWTEYPYPCGMSGRQFDTLHWDFLHDGGYKLMSQCEGAAEAIKLLAEAGYLLVFVTARPVEAEAQTRAALAPLIEGYESRLVHDPMKEQIIKHTGGVFDFHVDDNYKYVKASLQAGIPNVAMVNRPWNSKLEDPNVDHFHRAAGVLEAVEWFLSNQLVKEA
jgi:uncharacterized HAD superfamily protein